MRFKTAGEKAHQGFIHAIMFLGGVLLMLVAFFFSFLSFDTASSVSASHSEGGGNSSGGSSSGGTGGGGTGGGCNNCSACAHCM